MAGNAVIFVQTEVDGIHRWESAPEHRAYLRDDHRHRFGIQLSCEVSHDDREVEFHDLLDWLTGFMQLTYPMANIGSFAFHFNTRSCEQIAREIGEAAAMQFNRPFTVRVDEDGYVGAEVTVD